VCAPKTKKEKEDYNGGEVRDDKKDGEKGFFAEAHREWKRKEIARKKRGDYRPISKTRKNEKKGVGPRGYGWKG